MYVMGAGTAAIRAGGGGGAHAALARSGKSAMVEKDFMSRVRDAVNRASSGPLSQGKTIVTSANNLFPFFFLCYPSDDGFGRRDGRSKVAVVPIR
jgi:hypothetical protein